jgi:hypothetical protein
MTRSCRSNTPIYRSPPSSFTANRLGVPKERMITAVIEPDNGLTKARQGARRLVIRAGLSDEDIDRMIKQAQKEVEPPLDEDVLDTNVLVTAVLKLNSLPFPASTGLGANQQPRAGLGLASGSYLTDETRL